MTRVSQPDQRPLYNPVWSPDNSKIAATKQTGGGEVIPQASLYLFDVETGEVVLLLEARDAYRTVLDWSPDGKEILFSARQGFFDGAVRDGIWVTNADGSGKPRFVSEGSESAYSPTGMEIAITDSVYDRETQQQTNFIWILDTDTGDKRLVFEKDTSNGGILSLSWSPDATRLAFSLATTPNWEPVDIYLLNLATGDLFQLTKGGVNLYPAWSPDGDMVAYARAEGVLEEESLHIASLESGCTMRVTSITGDLDGIDWSPEDSRIGLAWEGDIYIMDIATVLGPDLLTTGPVCP